MENLHECVGQWVDTMQSTLFGISDFIFSHPELSDREFESSAYLVDLLKQNGFTVTCPYKGLETAFRAELETGPGPAVAFLAEYDALPGFGPEKKPAHACGHNWIAATTVGAGMVLAKMREHFKGRIVVFGTPAEETAGRKVEMAEAGAFDDIDAAFQMHLGKSTNLRPTTLAMNSCEFEFLGRASHAASQPEKGVNALDAVQLTFAGVNCLRQQLPSDVRVHGIVTEGGDAPNIIPNHCRALFYVRAARKSTFLDVFEKVKSCARGAAVMTGCELKINLYDNQFDDVITNPVLAELLERHYLATGVVPECQSAGSPGSTDVGNVSYRCPVAFGRMGIAGGEIPLHAEEFVTVANSGEAHTLLLKTVESFVCVAIELGESPELVERVRSAFEARAN